MDLIFCLAVFFAGQILEFSLSFALCTTYQKYLPAQYSDFKIRNLKDSNTKTSLTNTIVSRFHPPTVPTTCLLKIHLNALFPSLSQSTKLTSYSFIYAPVVLRNVSCPLYLTSSISLSLQFTYLNNLEMKNYK